MTHDTPLQKITKGIYSNNTTISEKWFSIIEYLIIVGVLRILVDKVKSPEKFVVIVIYLISHYIWFFYCLSIVVSVLNKNNVNKTAASLIGALFGGFLSWLVWAIAIQIASI